jgi:hypothetical protein
MPNLNRLRRRRRCSRPRTLHGLAGRLDRCGEIPTGVRPCRTCLLGQARQLSPVIQRSTWNGRRGCHGVRLMLRACTDEPVAIHVVHFYAVVRTQGRKSLAIMPGCPREPKAVRRDSRDFAVRGSFCAHVTLLHPCGSRWLRAGLGSSSRSPCRPRHHVPGRSRIHTSFTISCTSDLGSARTWVGVRPTSLKNIR